MITTEERISNAELLNNLVGIPWEEKGINYDGCDCVGIAKLYYEAKDIKVITDLSSTEIIKKTLLEELIKPEDIQEGDTLIFKIDGELHLGIYLGYGQMLQAERNDKSHITRLSIPLLECYQFAIRPKDGSIYLPPAGPPAVFAAVGYIVGGFLGLGGATLGTFSIVSALYGAFIGYSIGLAMNPQKFSNAASSPRYSFGELKGTATNQLPVPTIYGQVRVAGNTFYQNPVEGGDTIEQLIGLCEGLIESITDVRVNGIAIGELSGCSYTAFLGTSTQNVETDTGLDLDGVEYRHIACLYVKLVASDKLKGQPNVTCIVKGKKVNTWDGSSWAGSTYSANPAACLRDYLLTSFEAGGCGLSTGNLDATSFGQSYDRCAAQIGDGVGGSEARYTIGIVLDQKQAAIDNLSAIMPCFAAMLFRSGSTLKLKVKYIENAVQSFNEDDIGAFSYSQFGYDDKVNRFGIEYFDPDQNDAKVLVWGAQDHYDQDINGIIERTLTLNGVTRKTQALRLSNQYFYELRVTNLQCKFTSATKCIAVEPGDVIKVTHTLPDWANKLFTITEVEELEDYSYSITAIEYNPTIYDDSYGATIETFDYGSPPNPYGPVTDVTSVTITENVYTDKDGRAISDVNIVWVPPTDSTIQFLDYYRIEFSKDSGDYTPSITADKDKTTAVIHNVEAESTYTVKIKSTSINGIDSNGTESNELTTEGKTDPPDKVDNFSYVFTNELAFSWDKNSESDLSGYEIRDADTNWGTQNANLIYRGLTNKYTIVNPGSRTPGTYYIRAFNRSNIFSLGSRTATPVNAAPIIGGFSIDVYFGFAKAYWDDSNDSDLLYYELYKSKTGAFAGEETLEKKVPGTSTSIYGEPPQQGTADSATNNTLVDAWFKKYADDYFNGWIIFISDGLGKNQGRTISDFTSATGTFTISANWAVNPDATSKFIVTDKKFYRVRGRDTYGAGDYSPIKSCTFTDLTEEMLKDGAITGRKVYAEDVITLTAQIRDAVITNAKIHDLSADKINAGTIIVPVTSNPTRPIKSESIQLSNNQLRIYDENENLRVLLGNLTTS